MIAVIGGLGAAINEFLAATSPLSPACQILGLPDEFIEHGSVPKLHARAGLSPEQITAHVARALELWHRVPAAREVIQRG